MKIRVGIGDGSSCDVWKRSNVPHVIRSVVTGESGMGGYVSDSAVVKSVVIVNIQIHNMYFTLPPILFSINRLHILPLL